MSSQQGRRPALRPGSQVAAPRPAAAGGPENFQIFADGVDGEGSDAVRGDKPRWGELATQKERHKENTGVAVPWIGQQIKRKKALPAPEASDFAIFADEACTREEPSKPRPAGAGLRAYVEGEPAASKHRLAAGSNR